MVSYEPMSDTITESCLSRSVPQNYEPSLYPKVIPSITQESTGLTSVYGLCGTGQAWLRTLGELLLIVKFARLLRTITPNNPNKGNIYTLADPGKLFP